MLGCLGDCLSPLNKQTNVYIKARKHFQKNSDSSNVWKPTRKNSNKKKQLQHDLKCTHFCNSAMNMNESSPLVIQCQPSVTPNEKMAFNTTTTTTEQNL